MPTAAPTDYLNAFQQDLLRLSGTDVLTGTWNNAAFGTAPGGEASPFSYNVMPLPQDGGSQGAGYILKNFSLYEVVQFNGNDDVALPALAPNRGGQTLQLPTALFYQQQVYFAEGPGKGGIVHVENGAWLNLFRGPPLTGPYPPPPAPPRNGSPPQPPNLTIAKQISVPHGNSILALGSFGAATAGAPTIPDSTSTLPTGSPPLNTAPYTTVLDQSSDYQNPSPELTANPNKALQDGVAALQPNHYIHWSVTTGNQGGTLNIPFEHRDANVTAYSADYWLLSTNSGSSYEYLAYSQNITMVLTIGTIHYNFPHVTVNIVKKETSGGGATAKVR